LNGARAAYNGQTMNLGRLASLATLALVGCAAPALPPPVSAPPLPLPTTTAVEDWMSECGITLGGAHLIADEMIEAYRYRDIIKMVCLDDKQQQVDGLIRVMEDHLRRIQCTSDEEQVAHELMVLKIACRKIGTLRQEADYCVGEELFLNGG
jgi:hypothetical protein